MALVLLRLVFFFLLLPATSSFALYVMDRRGYKTIFYFYIFFFETEIEVNPDKYLEACEQLSYDTWPMTVSKEADQLSLFQPHSGSYSYVYLITHVGRPGSESEF